ncbi:MAG: type I-MYXAN CRISPR-associated protein Cas6/Cmx6 [Gammaproteobacteria bacterium]|nr:type I-MYXAN CRISPR-associated protein Cas6/Cmx6 [Gammaproteobacteria bacterium]MBU1480601.1 type I-MYXAN CRISPR-associated protein Cas6/Cmx6 [Gammaproteobacteria bacterium]
MIDVVFEISGETLPAAYPFSLWDEISRLIPQLGEHENVGIIPLRMAQSKEGLLLNKRAKLVLRLPPDFIEVAASLTNKQLQVAGSELYLGSCKTRPIQHYPTLHAHLVTGAEDEVEFMAELETTLAAMGVKANLICGRRHQLTDGERVIRGYSLVLHDLTPEGSLRVQYAGLGKERRFGCGIFVPYKVISSME